jgi:hypothetical protein
MFGHLHQCLEERNNTRLALVVRRKDGAQARETLKEEFDIAAGVGCVCATGGFVGRGCDEFRAAAMVFQSARGFIHYPVVEVLGSFCCISGTVC